MLLSTCWRNNSFSTRLIFLLFIMSLKMSSNNLTKADNFLIATLENRSDGIAIRLLVIQSASVLLRRFGSWYVHVLPIITHLRKPQSIFLIMLIAPIHLWKQSGCNRNWPEAETSICLFYFLNRLYCIFNWRIILPFDCNGRTSKPILWFRFITMLDCIIAVRYQSK